MRTLTQRGSLFWKDGKGTFSLRRARLIGFTWLFMLMSPCLVFAWYPAARHPYVNDYASILDDTTETRLRNTLSQTEYTSGVDIQVATIQRFQSYQTSDATWEQFATGLFNDWEIGTLPENNGVLFLISTQDRRIRIELGRGYSARYNRLMQSIIDGTIVPPLRRNDYEKGILDGVNRIIATTNRRQIRWSVVPHRGQETQIAVQIGGIGRLSDHVFDCF